MRPPSHKSVDAPPAPELSLVIPAHNEAERLPDTLERLLAWLDERPTLPGEIIVVDDGSSDGTLALLEDAAAEDQRVVPLASPSNRGKGAAVALGMSRTRGRYALFFDADLAYGLGYIDPALALLRAGAEVILGARDLTPEDSRHNYTLPRRLASSAFNRMVMRVLDLGIRDTQCGFKAFEGHVARALFPCLTIAGFGFDVELIYLARRWHLDVELLPVEMREQEGSSVNVVRHGLEMAADLASIYWRARQGKYPQRPPYLSAKAP